jgi:hypothetical protein
VKREDAFELLAGARPPAGLDRVQRVRWIAEAGEALLAGRLPSDEARLFLGGALLAWLASGGSLERDYLRTVKPKSHRTPSAIWREIAAHQDERQDGKGAATLAPSTSRERRK